MTLINAIILGVVQGVAEFLPISSSGHLAILHNLFKMDTGEGGNNLLFDVLLHIATLIAVCVVYRRDIAAMLIEIPGFFKDLNQPGKKAPPARRLILMIIIGTLPLAVILPFHKKIEALSGNTLFIAAALIVTGLLLYISDKIVNGHKTEKNTRVRDALIIGACQAVATVPGLSRSGTTITAGIVTGHEREYAVKYSFLLSLPAIIGAMIITLRDALKAGIDTSVLPAYIVGMIVAGVIGYFAIGLVRRVTKKGKFGGFAYYCWGVAALVIVLTLIMK